MAPPPGGAISMFVCVGPPLLGTRGTRMRASTPHPGFQNRWEPGEICSVRLRVPCRPGGLKDGRFPRFSAAALQAPSENRLPHPPLRGRFALPDPSGPS
ncbi:hypothetical protein ABIF74_011685 [Bradyrhizobium japonicum]